MKITIIGPAFPFRGGMASFNERLSKAFSDEDIQVDIENFKLQYPSFLFPGKTQYADWEAPKNIEIRSEISSVNPLSWIKVGRRIKKRKPDIVIIGYWMPFMAPCFGTISKIIRSNKHSKVIALLHNIFPHESLPGSRILPLYFVKNADAFVSLSRSVLNDLDVLDKKKPRAFSPHPLYDHYGEIVDKNEALDKLGLDSEYRYVLFFGLIRDYKGLDLLIDAFEQFKDQKIKLIVAGEFYSNKNQYLEQIKKLNLESSIILHDRFIPEPEVKYYFSAADIVAQPYKAATQSGVTQIAYHFEKPMLVTNVGGLPEIVPHNKVGFVVEPKPEQIYSALEEFFNKNLQEQFHKHILAEKEKYAWPKMTKTILNLYQQG